MLKNIRRWSLIAVVVLALVGLGVQQSQGASGKSADKQDKSGDQKKDKKSDNIAPQEADYHKADPSQYVGSDTCKTCHEEQGKSFERGPHWKTNLAKHQGPQWQGCEEIGRASCRERV